MLRIFDCAGDLARFAQPEFFRSEAYFSEPFEKSRALAFSGDTKLVPAAERLLDLINSDINVDSQEWEPSYAGAYPVVPDAIAGSPLAMRSRHPIYTDRAPIKVMVCQTSMGAVSSGEFLRRGVAVMALVMALQKFHPVELICFDINCGYDADGDTIIGWRIDTAPLDLAVACHTLTNVHYTRNLVYSIAAHYSNGRVAFPTGYHFHNTGENEPYFLAMKHRLGGNKSSLMLPPCHVRDQAIVDPVGWVNANVERFNNVPE